MKDAIGVQQCGNCARFHCPTDNHNMGVCVAHPPVAFFLGFAPAPPPKVVNPNAPPPPPVPVVRSFYPPVAAREGCQVDFVAIGTPS